MTIQLNLLPDVKKEFIKAQKTKALVISSSIMVTLGAAGITVLLFLYVTVAQQLQMALITNDIQNKTAELNSVQDLGKYLTIQNQLRALPELHDQKGVYSRLFSFLPVLNPGAPNNVRLSVLQLSSTESDSAFFFTGNAATFESLNVFVDTLNNAKATYQASGAEEKTTTNIFQSVVVQNSALSQVNNASSVSFTIRAAYDPAVFDARNTGVTATVPNIVTTPSITGSPQLFQNSEDR
jgi:hypothetical protein